MPDDTTDLTTEIRRNDHDTSEQVLILKTNKAERSMSNNIVTDGILSTAGGLAGKRVNLGFENIQLQGNIKNTQEGTYPTGGSNPSVDLSEWARATEKEMALSHAFRSWGPNASDGFDTLVWGPREITGMFSKLTTTQDRGSDGAEQYTYSIEWTHANVYVGDS